MHLSVRYRSISALGFSLGLSTLLGAQTSNAAIKPLITEPINDARTVVLSGNTRPEAKPANDQGLVSDSMPLAHLQMVLKRSVAQQAAAEQLLKDQADVSSPEYHKWLTNEQVAEQFGAGAQDVDTIEVWLKSKGFSINSVSLAEGVVDFSGTAGLVRTVFNAPLHRLVVNGKTHFGNTNDPQIPAALASAVVGIAALNDFMPRPMYVAKAKTTATGPLGYAPTYGTNYLSAGDLAKIYDFDNIFGIGFTGEGQTIVVIEDTNLYSTNDWVTFRKAFGLTKYTHGNLQQVNPAGKSACGNPGVNGDDDEAAVDVEWSSAAAPDATIVNAACADTMTQFGGFLALSNLLQSATPPKVVSISYGEAEASLGEAENVYISALYQTAALQGVSLYVSSGDEGAFSADAHQSFAYHGIGVSGYTSTPYNVSVGGTDVGYYPAIHPGEYFTTKNSPTFVTALSYIPEVPWNNSCAGSLVANYYGLPVTGPNSLCSNLPYSLNYYETTASGSGGPSGCATGAATVGDAYGNVVSGTCKGYPKPEWQSGTFGNPGDRVRDIPDVSLMASNGNLWGTYYALCFSDPANQGVPCGPDPGNWVGVGGTSVSSPIWAGIQALINQRTRTFWGNPNPVLYSLAKSEFGASGNSSCDASLGRGINAHCVFHDVTAGDIVVDCLGIYDCYTPGGLLGATSTSDIVFRPAYSATPGWDFATGIGTANAFNVVSAFAHLPTTP